MNLFDYLSMAYFYVCFLFGFWFYRGEHMRNWTTYDKQNNGPVFMAFVKSVLSSWWYWPLMVIYTVSRFKKEKEAEDKAAMEAIGKMSRQ